MQSVVLSHMNRKLWCSSHFFQSYYPKQTQGSTFHKISTFYLITPKKQNINGHSLWKPKGKTTSFIAEVKNELPNNNIRVNEQQFIHFSPDQLI